MGCLGIETGVDPEIAKILTDLELKIEESLKEKSNKEKDPKEEMEEYLKTRKSKLEELKKENKITEEAIRKLNQEELEKEIDLLAAKADNMHDIFTFGLDVVDPIRKVTLDKLMEKAKSAPAIALNKINSQIEEIKNYPTLEFLNSTYGKVLRDALEKKGMSATVLKGFKNKLFKERSQRRKVERDLYNIDKNEFDDENMDELKLDLFELIQSEYKDIDRNFREYARGKMVEAYLGSQ
jgi:hypothetical protein